MKEWFHIENEFKCENLSSQSSSIVIPLDGAKHECKSGDKVLWGV